MAEETLPVKQQEKTYHPAVNDDDRTTSPTEKEGPLHPEFSTSKEDDRKAKRTPVLSLS